MALFDKKPTKDNDVEDSLKILSTNLEVINQRLAQGGGSEGGGVDKVLRSQVQDVSRKMDVIVGYLKSNQNYLHQNFKYLLTRMDNVGNIVKQAKKDLSEEMKSSSDGVKKEVDSSAKNVVEKVDNLAAMASHRGGADTGELQGLINETHELKKILPQNISQIPLMFNQLDKKLEEIAKGKVSTSGEKLPDSVRKDIDDIKKNLHDRLGQITELTESLLKINRTLLWYVNKKPKKK